MFVIKETAVKTEIDPLLVDVDSGVGHSTSSVQCSNEAAMQALMLLYARPGMTLVDPTFGRGVFWKQIDTLLYATHFSDSATGGASLAQIAQPDASAHIVVLDPPYRHTPAASVVKPSVDVCYRLGASRDAIGSASAVRRLYSVGMREAHRVLLPYGFLFLKCQDTLEAGRQVWMHTLLMSDATDIGFAVKDLMVVTPRSVPPTRWPQHQHLRKSHSYFLVLRKTAAFTPKRRSMQPRQVHAVKAAAGGLAKREDPPCS
jgi:hypothetical protein